MKQFRVCQITSVHWLWIFLLSAALAIVASCSTNNGNEPDSNINLPKLAESVKTNAAFAERVAAYDYLHSLHEADRLPGDSKSDKGKVTTEEIPIGTFTELVYPFSQTFLVTKNGDSAVCHYTVFRQDKDAPWRLVRAWQTDAEGNVTKEWPITDDGSVEK